MYICFEDRAAFLALAKISLVPTSLSSLPRGPTSDRRNAGG